MPVDPRFGLNQITFAIERDEDQRFTDWIWVDFPKGMTVRRLAALRGHPEDVDLILDANGIRSALSRSSGKARPQAPKGHKHQVKVPGELRKGLLFHVMAGNGPPTIRDGYAKLSTVDRPERVGLTIFDGYGPIVMDVPIRFEATTRGDGGTREGDQIESDIELLERMAGRGKFPGSAVGPPPVIRLNTTDASGAVIPLIPSNYQNFKQNPNGPLWRISGIDWDENAIRNRYGARIRQLATVTVQQYTRLKLESRSVTIRAKKKKKTAKKKTTSKARH